jgi:hypothetical protein
MGKMPFDLPTPKNITIKVLGEEIPVDASVLKAGESHSWAREDHPTIVLNPTVAEGKDSKARDLLTDRKTQDTVREQALRQLADKLGTKGIENAEIITLGPRSVEAKPRKV